jgi:hypothetical protein
MVEREASWPCVMGGHHGGGGGRGGIPGRFKKWYRGIPSTAVLFHGNYRGVNFQYRPSLGSNITDRSVSRFASIGYGPTDSSRTRPMVLNMFKTLVCPCPVRQM